MTYRSSVVSGENDARAVQSYVTNRRSVLASGACLISSAAVLMGFTGDGYAVVKQGLLAGRVPGLSEPDAEDRLEDLPETR